MAHPWLPGWEARLGEGPSWPPPEWVWALVTKYLLAFVQVHAQRPGLPFFGSFPIVAFAVLQAFLPGGVGKHGCFVKIHFRICNKSLFQTTKEKFIY